ncbi:MAG: hypothetical protein DMG61_09955 [Acidobacteria bacterium]|nr:MAG: hypothetical protein DMG61_09955 [Acidobacteriota bacterium]
MRSIRVLPHRHQLTHGEIRLVQETMFISGSQTIHAVLESKILKVLPSIELFLECLAKKLVSEEFRR